MKGSRYPQGLGIIDCKSILIPMVYRGPVLISQHTGNSELAAGVGDKRG